MKKRRWIGMLLLCVWLSLTACTPVEGTQRVLVDVFRVGQADAILLRCGSEHVLIDCGEEDDAEEIVEKLQKRGVDHLQALVITHFDKDHVGGADGVLRHIAVDAVYQPAYEADNKQTRQYREALQSLGITPIAVTERCTIALGEVQLQLWGPAQTYDNDNDQSLMQYFACGEYSMLFAGDITAARIQEELPALQPCTVLKMPHHGKYNEQTAALLAALQPQTVLVTDSQKNPMAQETRLAVTQQGSGLYSTVDGDIAVQITPQGVRVQQ